MNIAAGGGPSRVRASGSTTSFSALRFDGGEVTAELPMLAFTLTEEVAADDVGSDSRGGDVVAE